MARKELKEKQNGTNERAILDILGTLQHPSIVPFLGSYTQHGVENFLFPYISMDLTQLFESERQMEPHDIYFGMYGIADALSKIHDFSFTDGIVEFSKVGYHHDLRPSNILVQGKAFLISDFGLSRLKANDQDSKSALRGGHDDYLAPESFNAINWTNGIVGRALDIWSFGCMLAEIATFIAHKSIAEFRAKRQTTYGSDITVTDSAFHLGGKVRPAVTEWLAGLTARPNDQQVPALVDLVHQMLNPNPYKRIKITAVVETFAFIAIDSKTQAIGLKFNRVLPPDSCEFDRSAAQIFLEHRRFEAWKLVFDSLHKDERLSSMNSLFTHLSNLIYVLTSARGVYSDSDEIERGSDGIITRIQTAIDSVCSSLPRDTYCKMQDLWTRAICEVQDIAVLSTIRSVANLKRYRFVGASAAMRYMSQIINNSISQGSRSRYIDAGCIDIDEVTPTDFVDESDIHLIEDRARTMGYMHGDSGSSRVMIEWKEYDTRWQGVRGDKLHTTMDKLVTLLDPNVTRMEGVAKERVLTCCGYFHEPRNFRFGFVYSLPSPTTMNATLFSINNVIRMTDPDIRENSVRPNLGDIFTLAKDISSSLHIFHNAGWLHKTISSHHLLIFSSSSHRVHEHVASAVLAGFNDSRPEASGYTLGPRQEFVYYQHPLYQTNVEFRKSFDYFGLGMILLELGLWRPASVLRSYHPEISSAEDFRVKLLQSYVPQLGERMGAVYRDAVAFCLDADRLLQPHGESEERPQDIESLFQSNVVEPLSHCFA